MNSADVLYQLWQDNVGRDWVKHGACRGVDPEIFMPEKGGNTSRAKAICNGTPATKKNPGVPPCPVREKCLEYSLQLAGPTVGVWGGKSERERRAIKRSEAIVTVTVKRHIHGTQHGYEMHLRNKTTPCDSCKEAHTRRNYAWIDKRRDALTQPALRQLVKLVHAENARASRTAQRG